MDRLPLPYDAACPLPDWLGNTDGILNGSIDPPKELRCARLGIGQCEWSGSSAS
jgi:hypothetical protein